MALKTERGPAGDRTPQENVLEQNYPANSQSSQPKQSYFDERLGVWVTVCAPGVAFGTRDLANWGQPRPRLVWL
jgi:hypothetical protein